MKDRILIVEDEAPLAAGLKDLLSGKALCLYYYNLACDIPLYDHITMEDDNDAGLSFWWYASTVRHLGISDGRRWRSTAGASLTWSCWT